MNTYTDLHARFYDLIYAGKPYAEEARWVAAALGGPVPGATLLDLACGTGRHALELAELGYRVTGVDYNPDLLEHAARAAAERGLDVVLERGDMRELDVPEGPFDAVTCLFDSIGYPGTNEGVVAALTGARRHLGPGGRLAVEFLHAPAMLRHASPTRVRRMPTDDGGTLVRISESSLDEARSLLRVEYELLLLAPDGARWERAAEIQRNRYFAVEEMRALMAAAGLVVERFAPAYADGEVGPGTWHVISLATGR